ncbi:MAG: S8 family serine peptidase [PVC group bacterium]|nr:S8 family serine peptidase [PVC group bacterium]
MKKTIFCVLMIGFVLMSPENLFSAGGKKTFKQIQKPKFVPGELLIKYKKTVGKYEKKMFRISSSLTILGNFKDIEVDHIKLPEGVTVEEAMQRYKDNPEVEFVEPNYYRYSMSTPNDNNFGSLWGLNNTGQIVNTVSGAVDADIDAPEAWDITTGSSDVVIAVIDSGVDYNHPDLFANMWTNSGEIAGNSIDDDANGKVDDIYGWDFVNNDSDPIDDNRHGTHVAGIIAGKGNNSIGGTGVCWNAKIMSLKVLNANGQGTSVTNVLSAITYANSKGADVINLSLGGGGYSTPEKAAIDASSAVVVCASGNDASDNDIVAVYPASYTSSNIIAVAATDQNDARAGFSNYGVTSVDVAAPGTNIFNTVPGSTTIWSDNFDTGSAIGWTQGGTNATWSTTTERYYSPFYSLAESSYVSYLNNTDSWAITPAIDLSLASQAFLYFLFDGSTEFGYDAFYVEASTDLSAWTNIPLYAYYYGYFDAGITGSPFYWTPVKADLSAYDGSSTVYIRFRFISDSNTVDDGFYFDNIIVTNINQIYNGTTEYDTFLGTSMAAPHVSGVAALIKSHDPSMTNIEIKAAIEDSVDVKASLSGLVATGGRINAYNAITPITPSVLGATAISSSQINLVWVDDATYETGFKVERKTGLTGIYSEIATVVANSTTYSDTGLSALTTYYYRIRANRDKSKSRYSNETSAATSSAPGVPSGSGGGGGGGSGSGGGCFIATATYGTPLAKEVKILCEFRDKYLLNNNVGKIFVGTYYGISPKLASYIADKELIKSIVRIILQPLVKICKLVQ